MRNALDRNWTVFYLEKRDRVYSGSQIREGRFYSRFQKYWPRTRVDSKNVKRHRWCRGRAPVLTPFQLPGVYHYENRYKSQVPLRKGDLGGSSIPHAFKKRLLYFTRCATLSKAIWWASRKIPLFPFPLPPSPRARGFWRIKLHMALYFLQSNCLNNSSKTGVVNAFYHISFKLDEMGKLQVI